MSDIGPEYYRNLRLRFLKHWWDETNNPLYVWETIALSLAADPPLPVPDWCLPYLVKVANKITDLARGYSSTMQKVFKTTDAAEEEWNNIRKKLPAVLEFASAGKKNVFSRQRDDAYATHASLDQDYSLQSGIKTIIRRGDDGEVFVASGITNANPAVVETDMDHGYVSGQVIRIVGATGISGVNGISFTITVISPTTFSIPLNTSASGAYTGNGIITVTKSVVPTVKRIQNEKNIEAESAKRLIAKGRDLTRVKGETA